MDIVALFLLFIVLQKSSGGHDFFIDTPFFPAEIRYNGDGFFPLHRIVETPARKTRISFFDMMIQEYDYERL